MKSDLSRKADAVAEGQMRVLEWVRLMSSTFHDARLIHRQLESFRADLDVCFVGEGDAPEEQVQLTRRAGHCRKNRRLFLVHVGYASCV